MGSEENGWTRRYKIDTFDIKKFGAAEERIQFFLKRYACYYLHVYPNKEVDVVTKLGKFQKKDIINVLENGSFKTRLFRIDPYKLDIFPPNGAKAIANLGEDDYLFFSYGYIRNKREPIFQSDGKYPDIIQQQENLWKSNNLD